MDYENSKFDKNTLGFWHLTVSMVYRILTGMMVAIAETRIKDDADHVKTSICPGMSMRKIDLLGCYC